MLEVKTQIGNSGRIVLPARLRKELDIQPGDEILLRLEKEEIRLIPLRRAVALAQANVRQYVPEGTSLVDGLIEQRRAESRNE
jgi:AbrB family looped-hinge helix DNA binding protein